MPISAATIASMKQKIDDKRGEIGRDVTFYTSKHSICTTCVASGYYDPVNDVTANYLCPLCNGTAWLDSVDATVVQARVHWAGAERITATPGGKYFIGDCTLGVEISYHELAQNAMKDGGKVLVDGHDMEITAIDPVGAPIVNRYRLICKSMGQKPPP